MTNVDDKGPRWRESVGYFLAAQNLFVFGSSSVYFAILWYIALKTSSGTWMMLATLATSLPQILISLFAGVWADRYDRRKLIIGASAGVTAFTLLLAGIFVFGERSLWLLLSIAAIRAVGTGIETPAGNALLPQLTPKIRLTRTNGLNQTLMSVALLLSPLMSGYILGSLGIGWIFIVDLATAVAGIILIGLVKIPEAERLAQQGNNQQQLSALKGIGEGIRYIFNRRVLLIFMIFTMFIFIFVTPSSQLSTLFVKRTFGTGVWRLTANEQLWTIGASLGGLYLTTRRELPHKVRMISLGILGSGLSFAAMALPEPFWVYLLFMFISGICMPIIQNVSNIWIQESFEPSMMGRIFSVLQIVSTGIYPIAMLFYGPLSDIIQIKWILLVTGLLEVGMGVIFYLVLRNQDTNLRGSSRSEGLSK